ncbi:hypothetical protein KIPE111705_44775 [Kibdelosporangium persicum]|uniref:DUF4352 domain-containing protein n=1 Tax=Kibdelosporangium persicum TaxID=2698649 RepID=A0ABX2F1M0_9PSEU|nr:hypothetical protein [Kibdelosporangium persicum]NRN64891.1 hypothetical protein [Kibdelosporangium persicum]
MRTAASFVLLATAALTVGCSSGQPGSPDQNSAGSAGAPEREVNKTLTVKQNDGSAKVTLVSVTESFKPDEDAKATSGNFVAVKLRFEGQEGEYSANPLYVMLKKADGTVARSDDGDNDDAVRLEQKIRSDDMDLRPGKSVEGLVAFDMAYDPGAVVLVTSVMGHVLGQFPVSGGEPILGDGSPRKDVNKSVTVKQRDASALVTLVSITESKGPLKDTVAPENGGIVIADMKFEGKTGEYSVNMLRLKLKTPDGQSIDPHDGNGSHGVAVDEEELPTVDLGPGKTAAGKVAFDAKLQPGTKLVIEDYSDKVVGEWPL